MQTCPGIAQNVRIAMQGLGEQRREPLSEDALVAAHIVGRHFAESMRIPMQESSHVILRCTPFSLDIPRNYLGYLHAGVCVVNNAWSDDAREEAMELLLEAMAEAGVQGPDPPDLMTLDQDPPRGDPSESDVPACAMRLGSQGTSGGVPCDKGTPNDAGAVHQDDQMQEGDTKEAIGTDGIRGDAQHCLPPQPPPPLTPMTADQDPRRDDPSESDVPACALRCGPHGAPGVAYGVHGDDEIEGREMMENTRPGVAQECLTAHSRCGVEALSHQGSPVPLAQRPPKVLFTGQDSEMSSPTMHSSLGTACTVMALSKSSTDGSHLSNSPPSSKKAMPRDPKHMPAAKCVRFGEDLATPIEIDNPNQKLEKDPLKAKAGRDPPTIRQLKLRLAPDG